MTKFCNVHIPDLTNLPRLLEMSKAEQLSNFGPVYRKFCRKMEKFLDIDITRNLTLVTSGHTALMAAYSVLGCERLVMPAYTFESTRVAATLQGIEPIIVDVDPKSGCLTVEILDSIREPWDSVVVVCALSTIPELARIDKYCKLHGKHLIIDGAASFGTPGIYNYGDAFCLSFHATKSFPLGEAGAVIATGAVTAGVKSYINFGFNDERVPVRMGINAKVSDYTAAMGCLLLDEIEPALLARKKNVQMYKDLGLEEFVLNSASSDTVYQTLPIYLNVDIAERARVALDQIGVEYKRYYKPLVNSLRASVPVPHTYNLFDKNICLPCHPGVTEDEIVRIVDAIRSAFS